MSRWSILLIRSRARRFARRHRFVRWLGVGVLAVTTSAYVHDTQRAAEQARLRWGETTTVIVARTGIPAGAEVDTAQVARTEIPLVVVPATALGELPPGVIAGRPLVAGEILLEGDIGIGGLAPAGSRGLAVPISGATPELTPGDPVDLVAWADPLLGGDGTASTLTGGVVIAVGEHAVTVAVPTASVEPAVAALVAGTITLVTK